MKYLIIAFSILLSPMQVFSSVYDISPKRTKVLDSVPQISLKKEKCHQTINGTVYFQSPDNKVPYAIIMLKDVKNKLLKMFHTKSNAKYRFNVNCDETYKIESHKKEFELFQTTVNTSSENKLILIKNLMIDSKRKKGSDRVSLMEGDLFFEINQWELQPKAIRKLYKAISLLKANPRLIIYFESHTDCRGSSSINKYFSEKRVNMLKEYVDIKMEMSGRAEGKAYGEKKPINKCVRGIKCTEKEHLANRRTTFIVKERD